MMSFQDFTLLPADDPQSTAEDDLAAAVAGAVALPESVQPVAPDRAQPFGVSWHFDWQQGQFVREGQAPRQVTGLDSLKQWCLMAIYSARYAHPVFSDDFGMEEPDSVIGEIPAGSALADWRRHLVDALMVHPRISSVENITLDWDPTTGILTILSMDVITDEDESVAVSDVTVQAGGA